MKKGEKKAVDITGQKFNMLTAIKFSHKKIYLYGQKQVMVHYWVFLCDCGKTITTTKGHVMNGHTKACGCLCGKTKTHGLSHTKLYKRWQAMIHRCTNPKYKDYPRYGGRGIKVCDKWQKFENYYEWAIKNGYKDCLQIDREENNGNYEPSNCRFVTNQQNSSNTCKNINLEFEGKKQTISEWSREKGINIHTLFGRIKRSDWSTEKALTTPTRNKQKTNDITKKNTIN